MPEGPEICIISNYLNDKLKDNVLKNIEILEKSRYNQSDIVSRNFYKVLNKKLYRVSFKGKKIIFDFGKDFLISFLGLEGKWVVNPIKHLQYGSIRLEFENDLNVFYYDTRHFGYLEYHDESLLVTGVPNVGSPWIKSEMFPTIIKKYEFYDMMQSTRLKKKLIMDFLLQQKYTSGIGNYIRADALYLSKISPYRLINNLTRTESDILYDCILKVIEESLVSNGNTIKSYLSPNGDIGYYDPYIYGKKNSKDTGDIVIRDKIKDRSIYWVPNIQI